MSNLFTPKSPDGRSEWRIVMDLFLAAPRGGTVTFEQLGTALNRDPLEERHAIYAAVGKAAKELRATHSRSVGNVPKVGYRVLEPGEHEVQAYGYHSQATKRMSTAVAVLRATPLDDLTEPQRRRTMAATAAMSHMAAALGHVAAQQRRQEGAIARLEQRVARLEDVPEEIIEDAEILTPDETPESER